jgi:hypothetical protein
MHPLIELNLVVPMQWDHFSRNLNSHMISIGFSKTHGVRNYCTPSPLRYALTIKTQLDVELLCSCNLTNKVVRGSGEIH